MRVVDDDGLLARKTKGSTTFWRRGADAGPGRHAARVVVALVCFAVEAPLKLTMRWFVLLLETGVGFLRLLCCCGRRRDGRT